MKTSVKELVQILSTDASINTLINGNVWQIGTADIKGDCIVYSPAPLSDDGFKETFRFTCIIVTKSLDDSMNIDDAVRNAIITKGDTQLSNNILKVTLNGGDYQYIKETDTHYHTSIYNITARK